MKICFQNVSLRAMGMALPAEEISSEAIEERLSPVYERLGLYKGRLELMTGIRARRLFPVGTRPSEVATLAAQDLLGRMPQAKEEIDCLIHAAVCRDFAEPATASVVHQRLGLLPSCFTFDLSNACLSWMNALVLGASLIESDQMRAVLVVSGEDARSVVETTIAQLNSDPTLTRQSLKRSLATLTLGSAGVAALLVRREKGGAAVLGGAFLAESRFHDLCTGGAGGQSTTQAIMMETDSATMLQEGVKLAASTWREMREALGWAPDTPGAYFAHQVGSAHRQLLFQALELDLKKDFSTFESLGNTGAAAVGSALVLGARARRIGHGDKVALLGIGSGLVSGMLGLCWDEGVRL